MTTKPQPTTETLEPCPFCGGPAEKRLTGGPKRGFIGCFTCMIGLPFNAPYGDTEVAAWNSRTSANAPPLCSVHAALDAKDELELEICNDCIACSLNQRAEMLKLLESQVPAGEQVDAVEFLRAKLAGAAPVVDEHSSGLPNSADIDPNRKCWASTANEICVDPRGCDDRGCQLYADKNYTDRHTATNKALRDQLIAAHTAAAATAAPVEQRPLPPLPTLYAMFEEWRTSFPEDRQPEPGAPQTNQLIDAWIAGFSKHNEIVCAAAKRRSPLMSLTRVEN